MATLAKSLPPDGLAGFRNVDSVEDPRAYAVFLDQFAASFSDMISAGIDLLELKEGAAVFDLGCGHGAAFPALAARIGRSGRIVGLDASQVLIAEGRRRLEHPGPAVEFHHGDAHALPFPDGIFSAARADRVFIFLRNPRAAFDELVRVTEPGGRLVVTESDLEAAAVDASDAATTRVLLAALANQQASGRIGRQVRAMFVDAGLDEVGLRLFPIHTTSLAEWNSRVGAEAALDRCVTLGQLSASAAAAWIRELRERDAAGRFLATGTFFMVSGTKPGTRAADRQ